MSLRTDQLDEVQRLLKEPNKNHKSGRTFGHCEILCSLVNLGIATTDISAGTHSLASKEKAERYVNSF